MSTDKRQQVLMTIDKQVLKAEEKKDFLEAARLNIKYQEIEICDCGAFHTSNPFYHSDWCKCKTRLFFPRKFYTNGEPQPF